MGAALARADHAVEVRAAAARAVALIMLNVLYRSVSVYRFKTSAPKRKTTQLEIIPKIYQLL
jgi:hypothetical protein